MIFLRILFSALLTVSCLPMQENQSLSLGKISSTVDVDVDEGNDLTDSSGGQKGADKAPPMGIPPLDPNPSPMPAPSPIPAPLPAPMDPSKLFSVINDPTSNIIEISFPNGVQSPRIEDFKVLNSHVKISKISVSGKVLRIQLDDHVLPDDALSVDYFMPSGTLKNSNGNLIASFRKEVDNRVTKYNGSKKLVQLQSGANISSHLRTNNLIVLKRGGTYSDNLRVNSDNITISAWGKGNPPVLNRNGGDYLIQVYSRHFRIANIELRSNGKSAIALRGRASFALINSNRIIGNNRANVKGIYLMNKTGAAKNQWGEGNWALNNYIRNHEDGIKCKLEPASYTQSSSDFVPWKERHLGGGKAPMLAELNDIKTSSLNGNEGDAIGMSRGGFEGSKIRRNIITGWGDDGIDNFGARGVIVEYNYLKNANSKLNTRGSGNGIKMGGDGGGQGQDDRSGNNIYRYNIIDTTIDARDAPPANAIGMSTNNSGTSVGPTYVYGNIVVNTANHAFQFDKADGKFWKIYNNIFIKKTSRGESISQYGARNLGDAFVANNIYGDIGKLSINSANNFKSSNLSSIYSSYSNLGALVLKQGHAVTTKGIATSQFGDKAFLRDIYGRKVTGPVIGPVGK